MEPIQVAGITFRLDPGKPLYEQIVDQVQGALARGDVKLNERLPSVRELAQLLKVNPNTVMRAYQDLERGGLLMTYRGQGTFITDKPQPVERLKQDLAYRAVAHLVNEMRRLGFSREQALALLQEVKWS
ncbi:GntR-type HTH domain protein [Acididesulfobacillus acetoxydans]|uniref:GntR-type HTH domain protein n=1 Tax=Acididesulfobacillus acetoxydans TaxID=1561005 RepID=A0A8S0W9L5_9FIRM|nr:GntR family transcriptional regulator [Acididesulfobacillus acetoxydans]CAA7602689.1 GntR-type HTH domain protein [Acididesulfobacillus acetoxydans]CEJ06454.1 helix_turn_helix gluconate operon transcriptional repressor [Acididesulfobacillus acetoxydans]